jgi:hypothetical protein
LFKPNSRILDACAGTGAYSLYLANQGHIPKGKTVFTKINDDASNMDEVLKLWNDGLKGTEEFEDVFVCVSPQEIEGVAIKFGLDKLHNVATDGMINIVSERLNRTGEENFQKYMELHYMMCEDQSIIGVSIHGLWIGRKKF